MRETESLVISIITTIIGIAGGLFGAMTFLKNQRLQRQAIILPLMREFDADERLKSVDNKGYQTNYRYRLQSFIRN
jgi:hypothetical protein